MAGIKSYKDLIAWQKSMDLVEAVYKLSALFPRDERFGLTAQIRKAAVSAPSNIAEGYSRRSRSDYVHFLDIALGSANEVETQALVAIRLRFVAEAQAKAVLDLAPEVQRILGGLISRLEGSDRKDVRGHRASPSPKT